MFGINIQKAWENYLDDYGMGRNLLVITFYFALMFFLSIFALNHLELSCLLPLPIAMVFFFFRDKIVKSRSIVIFLVNAALVISAIVFSYFLVGAFDRIAQGFVRLDDFFIWFDHSVFGRPVALILEDIITKFGPMGQIFYDMMMLAYLLYFVMPLYGGILYYRQLPELHRHRLGRYISSVVIFFLVNHLLYMLIPVTGPQYYMKEYFTHPLPLSQFGRFMYDLIAVGHPTFIDCFPSGHLGITFMVTFWLFRLNHGHRFFAMLVTFLVGGATLAMRYHYTLDLVAAVPLAIFSYYLGDILCPSSVEVAELRTEVE